MQLNSLLLIQNVLCFIASIRGIFHQSGFVYFFDFKGVFLFSAGFLSVLLY